MNSILQSTSHRPWPLPKGPWVMAQSWHDLLFAHWPIPPEIMRSLVPAQLPLDIWEGKCWIGVVPFWMSGVRARGIPTIPGLSRFPELNVRTYVSLGRKAGVYFFSLDAANPAAVYAARMLYHLPYFYARMKSESSNDGISYSSCRYTGDAEFRAHYYPTGEVELRRAGTLEHWLTERYCLYTVHRGHVYRGEVHHRQWPLQDAEASIESNSMANVAGIALPTSPPLLHFSRRLEVLIWPLRRVEDCETAQGNPSD